MTFRVWAPDAQRVEVQVDGRRLPMTAGDGGWWTAGSPSAGPGSEYAFLVDGGPPRPDPRSPWQPHGVRGPSRVVDDGRYSPFRRRHGRPPTGLAGHHVLGHLQNHDQIGNRATGERSSHLRSPGLLKVGSRTVGSIACASASTRRTAGS